MIFNVGDSEKILERVRKLYGEGKYERAIKTLERSLTGSRDDFPLLIELGKYLFSRNKFVESATNLKKAYHLAPQRWEEIIDAIESDHFASGTPVETGILLLEIYADKDMLEEARKIIDGSSPEQIEEMAKRYETIYNNVIAKKKIDEYTPRDLLHIYSLSLLKQKINLKDGLSFYEKLFLALPKERNKILSDLEKISQSNYSAAYPRFLTGKFLLIQEKYIIAIKQFERVIELDKSYTKQITELIEQIIQRNKIPALFSFLAKYSIVQGKIDRAIELAQEMETIKDIDPQEIVKIYTGVLRKETKRVDVHIYLAKLYARIGKYEPVLSELTSIIELNPEKYNEVTTIAEGIIKNDPYNANLLYLISDLYIEKNDTEKAISSLEKLFVANKELSLEIIEKLNKVLENNLDNLQGLNLLAQVYQYKKKFNEALLIYEHLMNIEGGIDLAENGIKQIIKENPDLLKAKVSLALLAFKKGKHKESLEIITSVVQEKPEMVAALIPQLDHIVRNSPQLASYVLEVYNVIPDKIIDSYVLNFAKAEAYSLVGDFEKATTHYAECFRINPETVGKVIDGLENILKKNNNLAYVHFSIGEILLKINKTNEALKHLLKVTEIDKNLTDKVIAIIYKLFGKLPDNVAITNALLGALLKKGAYEQVIDECENAINRFPKEKTGTIYLMHGQASLEKGLLKQAALSIVHALDIDESFANDALTLLKKALEVDRNNVVVKYGLAKAYIAAKQFSKAAQQFYEITKADPSKITKAIEELKKIVNVDMVNPDIHFVLGSLYLTEKNLTEAIKEFRAASELNDSYVDKVIGKFLFIEKHSSIPEVYLNLGELYTKKKMYSRATHYLMQAYRNDPELSEQAFSYLNKIKVEDPQNIVVLYAFAEIAEKEEDIEQIIGIYENILEKVPEETANVKEKVENLLKKYSNKPELVIFYSQVLSKTGEVVRAIQLLKDIVKKYPDELPSILEKLKIMSDEGKDEATFSLIEYFLEQNNTEDAIHLLKKLTMNFLFHDRLSELLKRHIKSGIKDINLILFFANFLFLREEWEILKDVIKLSEQISISEDKIKPLIFLKYLFQSHEGKEDIETREKLTKMVGKKQFYSTLKKLDRAKKKFQLEKVRFARKKSPDVTSLRLQEAEILNNLGYADSAIKLLTEPFSSFDDNIKAKYIMARSFFLMNNPIRSIEILRSTPLPKAGEIKNELLLLLSEAYEKIGDFKSALVPLKNCEPSIDIEKRINYLNEMSIMSEMKGNNPIISG